MAAALTCLADAVLTSALRVPQQIVKSVATSEEFELIKIYLSNFYTSNFQALKKLKRYYD